MRKALLVGINAYKNRRYNTLRGCLNDLNTMVGLCTRQYFFTDIDILTNRSATFDNITDSLKTLIGSSGPGDDLLFYFSGHGAQVPYTKQTADGKITKLDECIVAHDHSWDKPFVDEHLASCLKGLHEDAHLTLIIEACHSGGLTLSAGMSTRVEDGKVRPSESHKTLIEPPGAKEVLDKARDDNASVIKFGVKNSDPVSQRHVLYAGCESNGVSLERRSRGLFTTNFCKFARSKKFKHRSWNNIHRALKGRIFRISKKKQVPLLMGRKDLLSRPLFGKTE